MLYKVVRVVLSFMFIMSGTMKLSPILSPDIHQHMVDDFHRFYPINPLVELGIIKADADVYRFVIGATEVVCAVVMLLGLHASLVRLSYYILTTIMIGGAYTHYRAGDPLNAMSGALVFLSLLLYLIFAKDDVKVKVN